MLALKRTVFFNKMFRIFELQPQILLVSAWTHYYMSVPHKLQEANPTVQYSWVIHRCLKVDSHLSVTCQFRISAIHVVSNIRTLSNVFWIEPFTHIRCSAVWLLSLSVQCCPALLAMIFDRSSLMLMSLNQYGTVCMTSLQCLWF
jgi:hypothetical protein